MKQKKVSVPKAGLDPFGGESEALARVKREVDPPGGRRVSRVDYHVEDKGDRYEVTLESRGFREDRARNAGVRGGPTNNRRPEPEELEVGSQQRAASMGVASVDADADSEFTGTTRSSQDDLAIESIGNGREFDIGSHISSSYSAAELRDIARRNGIYHANSFEADRLADYIIDGNPELARRLAGR